MNKSELVIDLKAIDGFSKVFKNMESPLNSFMSQMKNLDQKTNFDKLKLNLDGLSKHFLKLSKDIDKATTGNRKKLDHFNKSLYNGFNEITRPFDSINKKLGNVLNSGLYLADDLNTNINRIANITHIEHDHAKILQLKNDAEDAARFIGESTTNFSSMMYTAAKNAVTTKQGLIDASKIAVTMAKDLQMDPHAAMESVVNFTHAYGEGEDKFNKYADLLVWMKEKSGSEMNDISLAMSYAAPVSKSFNIKETELAAMYTQMSLGGIKGSTAATAIKNFYYGTQDPNEILKKAKNDDEYSELIKNNGIMETLDSTRLNKWGGAVKKLGLNKNNIYDSSGNLRLFDYLIPQLQNAQKRLTTKKFNQNLRYMFGREGFSGISKLVALPKDPNGMTAQKSLEAMNEYSGKRMQQYEIYRKSYRGKMDTMGTRVDILKEKIANSGLLDLATKFVDKIGIAIDKFGQFAKKNPSTLKWMAGIGVATIAIFKLLGMIAKVAEGVFAIKKVFEFSKFIAESQKLKALKNVFIFFTKFKNIISIFSKFKSLIFFIARGLAIFALTNPFTAIIAGSALVAYVVYKNYDVISKFFSAIWNFIKDIFNNGLGSLTNIFDKIYSYYIKLKGKLFGDNNEIKGIPDQIDVTQREIQKLEPISLYIPKSNAEMNQLTSKSIIDINFNNAPKNLSVSSATKGNNPTKLNIVNMGFQDLAYE